MAPTRVSRNLIAARIQPEEGVAILLPFPVFALVGFGDEAP
jgi:hypothetical protein